MENNNLTIRLEGRIDSTNAPAVEAELFQAVNDNPGTALTIDADRLEYISSAGLRVLMKLCKQVGKALPVVNVSPEVYDIFETTGFTELLDVKKRLREVSVEGCEKLGEGANGAVYRLDDETIVKVYHGVTNTPEKITHNREVAREVFLHDIPTAISFDMVRVGDELGVVFEMMGTKPLTAALLNGDEAVRKYSLKIADMLKKLHSTEFDPRSLPDARDPYRNGSNWLWKNGWLSDSEYERVSNLIEAIPARNTFIHQDFHPGNLMLQDDELMLIDVDDSGLGHPLLDLVGMYQVYEVASRTAWGNAHFGEAAKRFPEMWDIIVRQYFETGDEGTIKEINRILSGYALIKHIHGVASVPGLPDEQRRTAVDAVKKRLFDVIDTLKPIPPV